MPGYSNVQWTTAAVSSRSSPVARFGPVRHNWLRQLLTFWLFVVCCAFLLGFPTAHADGGKPAFGLRPVYYDPKDPATQSYFIFDVRPGAVIHSQVRVSNEGSEAGSVRLYAVDATTGQTSGVVFVTDQAPRQDAGSWITLQLKSPEITIAAHAYVDVPFTVVVPTDVRTGQHVGGLVAEAVTQETSADNGSAVKITVQNLSIVAVQLNLSGTPVDQLDANGIHAGGEHGYQKLLVSLHNTGTMMLKPFGTLQVIDASGRTVENLSLTLDTFLPQTSIDYPVFVPGTALGVGSYRAHLTLTYGSEPRTLNYTTTFAISAQQVTQVFGPQAANTLPTTINSTWQGVPIETVLTVVVCIVCVICLGALVHQHRHQRR